MELEMTEVGSFNVGPSKSRLGKDPEVLTWWKDDPNELGNPSFAKSEEVEEIEFSPSAYTLVVASSHWVALVPMFIATAAQLLVMYVSMCATVYFYDQGGWLTPQEGSYIVIVVKLFSTVLAFMQGFDEFEAAGKIFTVIRRGRLVSRQKSFVMRAALAMGVQYGMTLIIMAFAMQIVLSRLDLIQPLWMTYYVFLAFSFDDYVCRFTLHAFNLKNRLQWKFPLYQGTNRGFLAEDGGASMCSLKDNKKGRSIRTPGQRAIFVYLPLTILLGSGTACCIFDVCPITFITFGRVTNVNKFFMLLDTWNLGSGCCQVKFTFSPDHRNLEVHAPILGQYVDKESEYPVLRWALWPIEYNTPSSLEVYLGKQKSSVCARSGFIPAKQEKSVQHWLERQGYKDSEGIYQRLKDPQGTVALYRRRWMYVANWTISDLPKVGRFRIHAIAENPAKRSLSDAPAMSIPLNLGVTACPAHCSLCLQNNQCLRCEDGFSLSSTKSDARCLECASYCKACHKSGPGKCDPKVRDTDKGADKFRSGCYKGYGLVGHECLPCPDNCENCDQGIDASTDLQGEEKLPCNACKERFGLSADDRTKCFKCDDKACLSCSRPDRCEFCGNRTEDKRGSVLEIGKAEEDQTLPRTCRRCPQDCEECSIVDLNCTVGGCRKGYVRVAGLCQPCAQRCNKCTNPDECDEGQCYEGYCDKKKCYPGFAVDFNKKCTECEKDCQSCYYIGSSQHCTNCSLGFGLSRKKECERCKDKNCLRCTDKEKCERCKHGFKLELVNHECVRCADECWSCDTAGAGKCDPDMCLWGWTTGITKPHQKREDHPHCFPCREPACKVCFSDPNNCTEYEVPAWWPHPSMESEWVPISS